MEPNTTTATQAPPGGQRAWERPVDGRIVAGVSGAVSRRLEIPIGLVRLLFVILAFFGGTGIVLYLTGWVLIPRVDRAQSPAQQLLDRMQGGTAWIGVGLIALAVLILADGVGFLRGDLVLAVVLIVIGVLLYRGEIGATRRPATATAGGDVIPGAAPSDERGEDQTMETGTPTVQLGIGDGTGGELPPAPPPTPSAPAPSMPPTPRRPKSFLGRLTVGLTLVALGVLALVDFAVPDLDLGLRHYLGLTVTVLGFGLVVGAWWGRARWLIVVAVLLTPLLLLSPLSDLDYRGEIGDLAYRPTTAAEVQDRYTASVGQLIVDLRALDAGGETIDVEAHLGIGELRVLLPAGASAQVSASVGMGEARVEGATRDGLGVELTRALEGPGAAFVIDARTNIGQVTVVRGGDGRVGSDTGLAGDRSFTATTESEIQRSYELLAGSIVLDLEDVTLSDDRRVDISVGTGDVTVVLPAGQSYDVEATVGAGRIDLPGESRNGLGIGADAARDTGTPELTLDIEVGTGSVSVTEGGAR